jgi:hypothetical protein
MGRAKYIILIILLYVSAWPQYDFYGNDTTRRANNDALPVAQKAAPKAEITSAPTAWTLPLVWTTPMSMTSPLQVTSPLAMTAPIQMTSQLTMTTSSAVTACDGMAAGSAKKDHKSLTNANIYGNADGGADNKASESREQKVLDLLKKTFYGNGD